MKVAENLILRSCSYPLVFTYYSPPKTEAKAKIEELNEFQRHGYVGTTDLHKMGKTIDSRRHNPVNTDSAGSDDIAGWAEGVEKAKRGHSEYPKKQFVSTGWYKKIRNQVLPPQSSDWATLYRVCGCIILLVRFIGTIVIAQKNEEAGFQFAVWSFALSSFLAAFLIDVLTDMRHYLKRIAEKE